MHVRGVGRHAGRQAGRQRVRERGNEERRAGYIERGVREEFGEWERKYGDKWKV